MNFYQINSLAEIPPVEQSQGKVCKQGESVSVAPAIVTHALHGGYGNSGLSRIPPAIFLLLEGSRQEYRNEMGGIPTDDSKGAPIGRAIDLKDSQFPFPPRLLVTTICKITPNKDYKDMLCVRGTYSPRLA